MPKYTVGVGENFPVDDAERAREPDDRRPDGGPEDERRRERRRRYHYRWHRSSFLFEATFILLAIWGVLHLVNGHGPRGLLIAAGITFAVAVVRRMFWRSHWAREEWRAERRRAWRD